MRTYAQLTGRTTLYTARTATPAPLQQQQRCLSPASRACSLATRREASPARDTYTTRLRSACRNEAMQQLFMCSGTSVQYISNAAASHTRRTTSLPLCYQHRTSGSVRTPRPRRTAIRPSRGGVMRGVGVGTSSRSAAGWGRRVHK